MKLNCIHCGGAFSVRDEQFGAAVACPHCHGAVNVPRADAGGEDEEPHGPVEPNGALTNAISGLASFVFHALLFIAIALIPWGRGNELPGEGEEVMIGVLPGETLSQNKDESLDAPKADERDRADEAFEDVEVQPPQDAAADLGDFSPSPTSMSSGGGAFDLGVVAAGGGGEGGWDGMIQRLRRTGLDVVIVFDSTGSMGGEIAEVKEQVRRIGGTLFKLVPKARISLVTYRDEGDAYVVKDPILPLTGEIQLVEDYLAGVSARGGGDRPEAVDAGLAAAIGQNDFMPSARKVILIFGDAPPHEDKFGQCLRLASDFNRQVKGIVSTVTCRQEVALDEFVEIAQVGGGEAFLTADEKQIVTQLMILVFGSQYRSKVVEAFELMER